MKMCAVKSKITIIDPGVCRCCGAAKKCRLLNEEYYGLGRKEVYSEMFVDCFGLVLSHLDCEAEDRLICATCVTRLREACCFRQQVLECEEKLLRAKILIYEDTNLKETDISFKMENGDHDEDMNVDSEVMDHNDNVNEKKLFFKENQEISDSKKPLKVRRNVIKKDNQLKRETKISKIRVKLKQFNAEYTQAEAKPPDKVKIKYKTSNDQSLHNLITIVENSYACPFNTFFNNFYCFYCKQKFIDSDKLREHTLTHDPIKYSTIVDDNLKRRNKTSQIDLFKIDCRICHEKIDTLDVFKNHVSVIHGKKIYPIEDDFLKFRLTSSSLKCTECEKVFSYFHLLKKHMTEHFGTCICDVCGAHYFEERRLLNHMKTHQSTKVLYPCKQCEKIFKSKYNLYIHISRQHTKEAAYLCSKCDETFFSDSLRQRHMINVHGEESTFKCEHCDKVYVSKKTLREHNRRTHLKLLKHQCSLCEKRFYLPCRLKEHMSYHTGEGNFRCEHCGKSYSRLTALKVHMQSHSSEKKYKCTLCTASYSQNVCLKNHMKRQHQSVESEKSFQS